MTRPLPVLLLAALCAGPAAAQPFVPADREAVELVRGRRTGGYVTVAATLAYAERASGGAFTLAGYRVERRPEDPFARVCICYRLGVDPPTCGLGYRVAVNPVHVEPDDRYDGPGRDLEHGPRAFLRALAREVSLQRQPELLRRLRAALDPYDPYDWR
ncbi:hypothetical protein Q8W71_08255 [Methylobacterium sp. NEAU 140]|uniref:hypothetical protein n=1 Tax=Methylobacterium sp. NEAU 140 TaxID=3064945 RepID=UPI0027346EC2|nr:hypothetical protein [Methylobacterium sp. NEAU 140]MDP4022610.1 hypothetical protein [Methylobacterium sp. NEAU 140]